MLIQERDISNFRRETLFAKREVCVLRARIQDGRTDRKVIIFCISLKCPFRYSSRDNNPRASLGNEGRDALPRENAAGLAVHAARYAHIRDKSRCRDDGTHAQATQLKSMEISARVLHLADTMRRLASITNSGRAMH